MSQPIPGPPPPANPLACYRSAPLHVRAHVHVRWRSCPFGAVEAMVPRAGRVLDIGCGHGLFPLHLARSAPARSVLGTDVDQGKIAAAREAAGQCGDADVRFEVGGADGPAPGPWDAVTVVDVLYLLPEPVQHQLVAAAAAALAPGGRLIVKEMSTTPRWKFEVNRVQETLAVRVLRLTHGKELTFLPDATLPAWFVEEGLVTVTDRRLDRGYPHPHRLLVAERPA